MYITKASGEITKFDKRKIIRTCLRAGADKKEAVSIANTVEKRIKSGDSTRKVLDITLRLLSKNRPHIAARYDLKGALLRLGPAGYLFERFIAELLREQGYKTKINQILKGAAVDHEVDIVAIKQIKTTADVPKLKYYHIECKYHNYPGIFTGLKDALYTYARFLDLQEGWKLGKTNRFDQAWLATNTKFSRDAIKYATYKKIKLLGWRYPAGNSLEDIIKKNNLYPLTILRDMDKKSLARFSDANIILCKDLIRYDIKKLMGKTRLSKRKLIELRTQAEKILS